MERVGDVDEGVQPRRHFRRPPPLNVPQARPDPSGELLVRKPRVCLQGLEAFSERLVWCCHDESVTQLSAPR